MISATDCPSNQQLRAYSLGQLPDEQSDELFDHLRDCYACQSELEQDTDQEDSLLRSLRDPEGASPYDDEPDCRRAVAQALGALAHLGSGVDETEGLALPQQLGEYEIVRPLGRGGMGNVYLARHTKLSREVALKVLAQHRLGDPNMRSRFEAEMRAVGRLSHPNIVTAHDAREVEQMAVLVTEYIDGLNLGEIVSRMGPLSVPNACKVVLEICAALQYTSEQGFVHRDVKPSNIMLSSEGHVKLLDLGLARFQQDSCQWPEITGTGQAMGTADYVSPEQVSDSRSVDVRSDIYSLGCTLYKLLSGHPPFHDRSHATVYSKMNAHVSSIAPRLSDVTSAVPSRLSKLVDSMLAKEPSARPQSPADVAQQLAAFTAEADLKELIQRAERAPTPASDEDRPPRSPVAGMSKTLPWLGQPVRRSVAVATGTICLLIGLVLGVIIKIQFPDGSTTEIHGKPGTKVIVEDDGEGGTIGAVPNGAVGVARTEPLRFAVLVEPGFGASVEEMRHAHSLLLAEKDPSILKTPVGTWYPVKEDVTDLPNLVQIGTRQFVLVRHDEDGCITWNRMFGSVGANFRSGGSPQPSIELHFTDDLGDQFAKLTRAHMNRRLAIVFDGQVASAPIIRSEIRSKAMLTGNFTDADLLTLSGALSGGANPMKRAKPKDAASALHGYWYSEKLGPEGDGIIVCLTKDQFYGFDRYGNLKNLGSLKADLQFDPPHCDMVDDMLKEPMHGIFRLGEDGSLHIAMTTVTDERPKDFSSSRAALNLKPVIGLEPDSLEFAAILANHPFKSGIARAFTMVRQLQRSSNPMELAKKLGVDRGRVLTEKNLKTIGIAFHNFHDAYKKMPGEANHREGSNGVSGDAKHPFSWRVAILPFIDELALYQKYRFDEPWDSENNRKLLAEMPEVYRSLHAAPGTPMGSTHYLGFAQEEGYLSGSGHAFRECYDGTSNTILLAESAVAVPWTKPEDLRSDKPASFTGKPLMLLMVDGAVRKMDLPLNYDELKRLITFQGGEPVTH